MRKKIKILTTRLGTCRSGTPFDLPDDLMDDVKSFFWGFEARDRVDVFCMCEASIRRATNAAQSYSDYESIKILSTYLWKKNVFPKLEPTLIESGLRTSTDYVQHGQPLLVPWML